MRWRRKSRDQAKVERSHRAIQTHSAHFGRKWTGFSIVFLAVDFRPFQACLPACPRNLLEGWRGLICGSPSGFRSPTMLQ
jgi:hypothetical protein